MRPPAECDVLVAGSGAGGLAAAVTAARLGLHVVVAEKESHFGGTTAFSGGWLWVPNHPLQKSIGVTDSIEAAATYLLHEAGENFDAERVDAFLRHAPQMVEFFMRETAVRFDASATFSDYHPDAPGGLPGGRSIVAQAFDGRQLGPHLAKLRPPLPQLTVFGIMIGSGVELMHFMRWSKSLRSAAFVARRLLGHGTARAFHGRGVRLTNGNALAGRLLKSALDAGVTLLSDAAVSDLSLSAGRAVAAKAGIDVPGFAAALRKYNEAAKSGSDPDFRKGENAYNRFYGDPDIRPNPCVAPIVEAPFYAVKVVIGDLGTYAGIATNGNAQVLDRDRKPIPGLYAAGNDALSIMGGAYPGPGITLGPAMTFGWLAARHMARNG